MSSIAFIDNFINDPVNHCVNDFVEAFQVPITYHQPARYGFSSLDQLKSDPLGVVILGSASHVTEEADWHKELDSHFKKWQEKNIPVLGICFGHQFIVHSFGGEVDYYSSPPVNTKAIRKVAITENFWSYKKGMFLYLPYAHEQVVTKLPAEFMSLAKCDSFKFEIIKHKDCLIYGLQAHPESSLEFMSEIRSDTDPSAKELKTIGIDFLGEFLKICQNQRHIV